MKFWKCLSCVWVAAIASTLGPPANCPCCGAQNTQWIACDSAGNALPPGTNA